MTALPSDAYVRFGRDGVAGVNATVRLTGNSHVYCSPLRGSGADRDRSPTRTSTWRSACPTRAR